MPNGPLLSPRGPAKSRAQSEAPWLSIANSPGYPAVSDGVASSRVGRASPAPDMWSEEQPDNSAKVMTAATATAACAGNHRFIARPGDIPAQPPRVAICGGTTWDNGLACKRMPCLPQRKAVTASTTCKYPQRSAGESMSVTG